MMIRSNDAEASQVASQIFAAHKDNLAGLPAAIRAQVLINEMKHHETKDLVATYLDLYTHATDAVFKRQLSAALAYSTDADNIQTLISSWKDKFVVKPQDLSAWYYQFLAHQKTQGTSWSWARENWDWIKAALGGDMSFDSFVILPAHVFKTEQRLAEYKTFFEPQLSDLALSRNIRMGIKEIAARVDLIKREKAAVEAVVAQYAKA
jgi:membrane alanyl aminopeptidase